VTVLNKLREGDDLAARLLRAGVREQPRHAVRRRAERALGLSTVAVGAAVSSTAAATGSAAGVSSGSPVAVAIFAKWLTVGMLAGGAAAVGVTAIDRALEPAARSVAGSKPAVIALAPPASVRGPELPVINDAVCQPPASCGGSEWAAGGAKLPTEPRQTSSPRNPLASTPAAAPGNAAPPARENALALSREVELLEGVRAKLRRGNGGAALAELDAVVADIQILRMEADLLRVEALLAHGERARAEALALELQRRDPGGGQSFRLKRLLGSP
jgi:hypothetical protein